MDPLCMVKGCRFSTTHVTRYHRCGTCGMSGHGQMECQNPTLRLLLTSFLEQEYSTDRCTDPCCSDPKSHHTSSHCCQLCQQRHLTNDCHQKINYQIAVCPFCRETNFIKNDQPKVLGIEDKCLICEDNHVEVFFPQCGHTKICQECLNQLKS